MHKIPTNTPIPNTNLMTCMPSRISTFLGTAEDLQSINQPKVCNMIIDRSSKKKKSSIAVNKLTSVRQVHIPAPQTERGPNLCKNYQHQRNGASHRNPCSVYSSHCKNDKYNVACFIVLGFNKQFKS